MTGNLSVLRYINFVFLALILRPIILAFSSKMTRKLEENAIDLFNE